MNNLKFIILNLILSMSIATISAQSFEPYCDENLDLKPLAESPDSPTFVETLEPPTNPEKNNKGGFVPKERLISWVHGLGGDNESWVLAGGATQSSYLTRPTYPTYTQQSLKAGGLTLYNNMQEKGFPVIQQANLDITRSFVIAHSHGGLTSREAHRFQEQLETPEHERVVNGVVTFGASHDGAEIAGNQVGITDWINSGAGRAGQAYIYLFATSGGFSVVLDQVSEWVFGNDIQTVIENGVLESTDFLGNFLIPIALSPFIQPVTDEIVPNSPALNDLNSWVPSEEFEVPTVAFYGVEEEPVLWKYVSSVGFDKTNQPFGDDFDETAEEGIEDFIIENQALVDLFYENWLIESSDGGFIHDFILDNLLGHEIELPNGDLLGTFILEEMYNNYINFSLMVQWFENANFTWKILIGATAINPDGPSCGCYVYENGLLSDYVIDDPGNLNCNAYAAANSIGGIEYVCSEVINTEFVESENDGVVTAASQMAYPDVGFVAEMVKTNHQQMRNCTQTEARLKDLFSKEYGAFFETEAR